MDFTQVLAVAALVIGGGGGLYTVIRTVFEKKLRTPADRQSEVEFGVGILKTQIEKAERDATRWLDVEQYLREELRKTDADKDRLQGLLTIANEQISSLIQERNDLRQRLSGLANKVSKGQRITLADITGDYDDSEPYDFEEDTYVPKKVV